MSTPTHVSELQTPALVVDKGLLEQNLQTMATALPGARLRPHVKAHKSTDLARLQREIGHPGFTVQTVREAEALHAAGLGQDVLLTNELADLRSVQRIAALWEAGARVTLAVDSEEGLDLAAEAGVKEVVIDVNVGLPRCGIPADLAPALAQRARSRGVEVRGVMGYEGHLMIVEDREQRQALLRDAMKPLFEAAEVIGGELVSAGGTGDYDQHVAPVTEVQAGSYALMDTYYAKLGLPFGQALQILTRVVSVNRGGWAVCDVGLKSHGMDHGNASVPGHPVWLMSDEHTTFANVPEQGAEGAAKVGDLLRALPAHVDPTVNLHERMWLVEGDRVVGSLAVDCRGW